MGNYLNIGNAGFMTIRNGDYVDKTGLIAFINSTLGTKRKLTCVSRPRRFGKSFATQMLCAYYDKSCDSRKLFSDLEISKDNSFEKYLNKYDVIYLDITLFITSAIDKKTIVKQMQDKMINEVRDAYPDVSKSDTLIETLANVSDATSNKFIVIIDEWDALFREAKNDTEIQKGYIQFLRTMFKSSLTDKAIEAAYMTGILPIKKYGTQSAMTDFREYTMLLPKMLAKYVGFSEHEVMDLCEKYGMDFGKIKRWYNGYSFGGEISVYNPNSVMEAVLSGEIENYWTQSETYESLKIYIDLDEDGLRESIVQMLGGANVKVDVGMFQNDMNSINTRDEILTLLVHLGYLAYDSETKTVRIPNEEVKQEFVRAVTNGKHKEIAKLIKNSDNLLEQTLNMDEEAVAVAIEETHRSATAPTFYNNEQALRSVI